MIINLAKQSEMDCRLAHKNIVLPEFAAVAVWFWPLDLGAQALETRAKTAT